MQARSVTEEDLQRLKQEREAADRRYNEALSELDAAVQRVPDFPHPDFPVPVPLPLPALARVLRTRTRAPHFHCVAFLQFCYSSFHAHVDGRLDVGSVGGARITK